MEKNILGLKKPSVRNVEKNLWSEKDFLKAGYITKKIEE